MRIEAPGYYPEMSMADYLADPCPEPSLSSKIVGSLFRETPQRARMLHPRLNPASLDITPRADIGSAVHSLAHGGYPLRYVESVAKRSGKEAGLSFVPTDWKTQDAKDAAEEIRAAGGIPLLPKDRIGVESAASAITSALADLGPGKHEITVAFHYRGVWLRGRCDWLSDGPVMRTDMDISALDGLDSDTKTVDAANAVSWIKSTLYGSDNLDVQLAIRHLAHIELTGQGPQDGWLLQEYEAPYDTQFVGASEECLELGVRKVNHACDIWRRCLDEQRWPGNPRRFIWAVPPQWAAWEVENRGVL
jgi:hypothetical protein